MKFGTGGEGKVGKNDEESRAAPFGGPGSVGDGRKGARRRRAATVGVGDRRRGCSGSRGWKRSGRGAARERGGAEGRVCAGGAAVEERGDGELEHAGVRAAGGGVLEVSG